MDFFFSFKYFICIDGSGLCVGVSACLEMIFAFPVIISLYFLSSSFALEVFVLQMSHRKQKSGSSTRKSSRVLFYWLECCGQLLFYEDGESTICNPARMLPVEGECCVAAQPLLEACSL